MLTAEIQRERTDNRLTSSLCWQEEQIGSERMLKRASQLASADWLATLGKWDLYATLTYDRRREEDQGNSNLLSWQAYTERACAKHVEGWLKASEKNLRRPVKAVAVVELHKSTQPHAHALVDVGGLQGDEFRRIGPLWYQYHGYGLLEPFQAELVGQAGAYLAKYMVKADPELVLYGLPKLNEDLDRSTTRPST